MVVQWLNSEITLYLRHVVVGKHVFVHHCDFSTEFPYHIVCVSLLNDLSNTYQISCILRQPQASYLSKSSSRTSSAHLFASMPASLLTAKNSPRHRSIYTSVGKEQIGTKRHFRFSLKISKWWSFLHSEGVWYLVPLSLTKI